jgi:hypothetical protein
MSTFTDHSIIEASWNKWRVTEAFRFYHDDNKKWIYDEVEEWFEFDWCSIPICILWPKIEPCTLTACCYHDWLFKYKPYWFFKSNYLFLVAMRVDKVKTMKKLRYYIWVNLWWWITRYLTGKTSKFNILVNNYLP